MKSAKIIESITLFIIVLILINTFECTNYKLGNSLKKLGITETCLEGSSLNQNELAAMWSNMFTMNRGQSCQSQQNRKKLIAILAAEGRLPGQPKGMKGGNAQFAWIKRWGYGEAAYLFDFFDPVFQKDLVSQFKDLYNLTMSISNADTAEYKDPLDIKKLVNPDNKNLLQSGKLNLKHLNPNYNPVLYEISVNSVQIRTAMKQWSWFIDVGQQDYAVDFIMRYDINGDGRLNARELVIGTIMHNKNAIGSGLCTNCFQETAKKMDSIFIFLDCNNDGFLSSEDLWNALPKLNRGEAKWNIFGINNNENIRTSAINDFVLKNGVAKEGSVTKEEFRTGLLLGYWDRQTRDSGVIEDDSRNLKSLRWTDGGMTDTVAFNYLKEKTLADLIAKSQK
jgi:hypothetical protein